MCAAKASCGAKDVDEDAGVDTKPIGEGVCEPGSQLRTADADKESDSDPANVAGEGLAPGSGDRSSKIRVYWAKVELGELL